MCFIYILIKFIYIFNFLTLIYWSPNGCTKPPILLLIININIIYFTMNFQILNISIQITSVYKLISSNFSYHVTPLKNSHTSINQHAMFTYLESFLCTKKEENCESKRRHRKEKEKQSETWQKEKVKLY